MLLSLVSFYFLLYSSEVFSLDTKDSLEFSQSKAWRNLLYYDDSGKSHVVTPQFFIHPQGNKNPHHELLATVKAFIEYSKNHEGEFYECLFPARFTLLFSFLPPDHKRITCTAFEEWLRGLDIGNIYLVYTSAYPNNPASTFGHTFFLFDRRQRSNNEETKRLLGYSLSFQAHTNQSDSAVLYTIKGITGGYLARAELNPYYINIGVYNNSESRDLWEYPLNMSEEKKIFFVRHMWEIQLLAAFPYYFFDENCSTLLLRMLEAVFPEIKFKSKDDIFVVPQTTLREVVQLFPANVNEPYRFHPSIKRKMYTQLVRLNSEQRGLFNKGTSQLNEIKAINDAPTLDLLVDFWKWKNYQANTNLSENEKLFMRSTLLRRSEVTNEVIKEQPKEEQAVELERPDKGHPMSNVKLLAGSRFTAIGGRYGFHDFFDNEEGYDGHSFVKLADFSYGTNSEGDKNHQKKEFKINALDILSLQHFHFSLPAYSWRISMNYAYIDRRNESHVSAAGGIGITEQPFAAYLLGSLHLISNENFLIRPGVDLGAKWHLRDPWKLILNLREVWNGKSVVEEKKAGIVYQRERYQIEQSFVKHTHFRNFQFSFSYFF
ncbi:MAG: DUF4105 domain-containing protein [Bacteriovoracaceae bacterium]|nr:DUF4105 domain-containing protein [Bacteriovoracaceae bacterium]